MKANRIAVATFFFVNGFFYASWASRLPELEGLRGISNAQLGSVLFVMALGAVAAMPYGSATIIKLMGIGICASIGLLAVPHNLFLVGVLFFLIGVSNGAMDVTMNEQAVLVERKWDKPIMSSFHGFWSIGMALGAGAGALFSKGAILLHHHLIIITALGLIIFLIASSFLIKDKIKSDRHSKTFVLPDKVIIPLGFIAFCGMLFEGAIADWSAIYMNSVIGETEVFSAVAFGSFGVSMTIGRLMGDYFTQRLGKKKLMIWNAAISISGFMLVLVFNSSWMTIIGFFLVGLGLATVVPIVYSMAGNVSGISPSMGIAMVTTIGYSGFFVGPPAIGYLADIYGLRVGLSFSFYLLIIMLILILRQNFRRFVKNSEPSQ
ncbi:MAG: MFS transporter [Bacteroidetes bacterium]|nr:MFS transporter [Bacteroidota bacterium]MDA1121836.1 MFS transporter [Bacteroidota bacterium]